MKQIHITPLAAGDGGLTGFLHDPEAVPRGPRPAVLICPGGGYRKFVTREAEPVALSFLSAGFNAFFVEYTLCSEAHPDPVGLAPLAQAARALRLIRDHAGEWGVREDQVAVLGFSAGGHLAGSCALLWDEPRLEELLGEPADRRNRPDAAVLCYPVVLTVGPHIHQNTVRSLAPEAEAPFFDLPRRVRGDTPPCFLWSTVADERVPPENLLELAAALQKNQVPYELHLYTWGRHGLTLGTAETGEEEPHLATWVPLCKQWLGRIFDFPVSL